VLNLGSGRGFSVREVLTVAEAVTGKKIAVQTISSRAGDPPVLIADNQKAREVMGWIPHHVELAEIIGDAWSWMRKHPAGYSAG
jgi:UDP-glucose 4-epimerase